MVAVEIFSSKMADAQNLENTDSESLANGSDQSQTSYISDSKRIKQYVVHKFLVESILIRRKTIGNPR